MSQLLKTLSKRRPRVLVIDDGQWGPESLSFVRYLRRRHSNMPVLVLVTVRIDALSRRSPQAASLSQLASDADTLDIRLGPLAKEAHRELLVSRLVLDPEVVAYLEKRTHGNPLFTEELVRHWIRSEILEPGPRGFRLRSTVDNSIPDTVYDVWAMRIDSAFHPSEIDARQSIQIAAVLGHRVSISEWNAVCSRAGLTSTSDILERLLKEQMIDPNIEGEFEFSHVLLRESLQRAAGETGQLANHHSLCADVLLSLEDIEPLRVGEHLFSAQRYEEASEHFGRAALLFGNVSDYAGAQRALIRWAVTLRRLGVGTASREWLTIRTRWTVCMRVQGRKKSALRHAERNVHRAREAPFGEESATALLEWLNHIPSNDVETTLATVHEGIEICERIRDVGLKLRFLNACGRALSQCGRIEEAKANFEYILTHSADGRRSFANAYLGLGHICEIRNDRAGALAYAQKADELGSKSTSRWEQAHCRNNLGNALRKLGRIDEAEVMYREAADMLAMIGNIDVWASYANIGLLMIEQKRYTDAIEMFDMAKASVGGRNDEVVQVCIDSITLLAESHLRAWGDWDRRIAELECFSDWHETQLDVAISLARAADEAERAGESRRAQKAWRLALTVFDALGLQERGQEMYDNRFVP